MDKNKLVRAIRLLASTIETMSDAEIDAFFAGMAAGELQAAKPAARRSKRPGKTDLGEVDEMIANLQSANSREAAASYLGNLRLTRRDLTAMARRAHVHITKEDNVEQVEQKLVEALVGARLNSLAIRGEEYPRRTRTPEA